MTEQADGPPDVQRLPLSITQYYLTEHVHPGRVKKTSHEEYVGS